MADETELIAKWLFEICRARLTDDERQDLYLKLRSHAARGETAASIQTLEAFVAVVLRRMRIDQDRRRAIEPVQAADGAGDCFEARILSPIEAASRNERLGMAYVALDGLPEIERAAFVARVMEGKTREIVAVEILQIEANAAGLQRVSHVVWLAGRHLKQAVAHLLRMPPASRSAEQGFSNAS